MQTEQLIPAEVFCTHYHTEFTFINSLYQSGLIEIVTVDETAYIQPDDLQKLEKIIHLHYDLEINIEGIETIINLLDRIENMQHEFVALQNRLGLYETNE